MKGSDLFFNVSWNTVLEQSPETIGHPPESLDPEVTRGQPRKVLLASDVTSGAGSQGTHPL